MLALLLKAATVWALHSNNKSRDIGLLYETRVVCAVTKSLLYRKTKISDVFENHSEIYTVLRDRIIKLDSDTLL